MILLEFLLSLTPSAKEKWKTLVAPNRSVQFAFTLNAEDVRAFIVESRAVLTAA